MFRGTGIRKPDFHLSIKYLDLMRPEQRILPGRGGEEAGQRNEYGERYKTCLSSGKSNNANYHFDRQEVERMQILSFHAVLSFNGPTARPKEARLDIEIAK